MTAPGLALGWAHAARVTWSTGGGFYNLGRSVRRIDTMAGWCASLRASTEGLVSTPALRWGSADTR
jgi:hypothetical protein